MTNVKQAFDFTTGDFETAWLGVADSRTARHRGNYMFFRQAVLLWQIAAALYGNPPAQLLQQLTEADTRYAEAADLWDAVEQLASDPLALDLEKPPFDRIAITGAQYNIFLPPTNKARKGHLVLTTDGALRVRTDVFYWDLKTAFQQAYLSGGGE